MKIAVWYNLPSGGAKRALFDHVRGLLKRGHHIESWRPPLTQQSYLDLSALVTEHEVPIPEFRSSSSFKPKRIYENVTETDRHAAAMNAHAAECARQIEAGDFDVVFANTDVIFHAPHLGRHIRSLPRVLYLQEPNRPFYEARPRLPWLHPKGGTAGLRTWWRDYVGNRAVRTMATTECDNAEHYDRILVNSRFSRESTIRTYGGEAEVCYLGIDPGLFQNLQREREPFVMSVGSMHFSKGPEFIIRSLAQIPTAWRPRLVWPYNSGEADYIAQMNRLASELGVVLDMKHLIPDDALVDLLNRAQVFVYAPRLEPFGLAPLEANACGTPVVAVAEGGVRETVIDGVNGVIVDHDHQAFAEGVRSLLADSERARKLGENGERLVREKWSVDAAAERLEKHLTEVVATKKGR